MVDLNDGTKFVFYIVFAGIVVMMGLLFLTSVGDFYSVTNETVPDQVISRCEVTSDWAYLNQASIIPTLSTEHVEGTYSIQGGKQITSYTFGYLSPQQSPYLSADITNATDIKFSVWYTNTSYSDIDRLTISLKSDRETSSTNYDSYYIDYSEVSETGWYNFTLDLSRTPNYTFNPFDPTDFDQIEFEFYTSNPAVLIPNGDIKIDYVYITFPNNVIVPVELTAIEETEDSLLDITGWLPTIVFVFAASLIIGMFLNNRSLFSGRGL